jgi:hypothetical protein
MAVERNVSRTTTIGETVVARYFVLAFVGPN